MRQMFLAIFALALTTACAFAHGKSEQTIPANEATVTSVETIEMRFDDPMRVTAISMTGPDGDIDLERETGMEPVTVFRAMPSSELIEGDYTVEWRGISSDGHPMQGTFGFTLAD